MEFRQGNDYMYVFAMNIWRVCIYVNNMYKSIIKNCTLHISIEPSIAMMYDLRIVYKVVWHITQRMRSRSPFRTGNRQLVRREIRDFTWGEHDLTATSFHLALVYRREAEVVVQMMWDYPLPSRLYVLQRAAPQSSVDLQYIAYGDDVIMCIWYME